MYKRIKFKNLIKRIKNLHFLSLLFVACSFSFSLVSCYSLSGASIHPEAKTVQIPTFPNRSIYQNPNISQEFSLALQDRFIQRTKLSLVDNQADMLISGEITSYDVTSVNVQAGTTTNGTVQGETSAQNRLTMTVNVRYESKQEPEKNFEKTFSDYADFEGNQTIEQSINNLTPLLNKRLIDQIFNAIAVDW